MYQGSKAHILLYTYTILCGIYLYIVTTVYAYNIVRRDCIRALCIIIIGTTDAQDSDAVADDRFSTVRPFIFYTSAT